MATIRMVLAFILAIPTFITPYVQMAVRGGVDKYFENWSVNDEYKADYAVELKKDPNKDFVVLNFSDIQLNPEESYGDYGKMVEETVSRCVEDIKPDLITLSGDNAWGGDLSYVWVVKLIDSLGIPWAPVMGNHDGSNGDVLKEFWCSSLLNNAKFCLFKFGPKDMGYGNYVINITENGRIIHTLFMMDSHSDADDTEASQVNLGQNGESGYDHFWTNQIEWYEWAVNGIARQAGSKVESTVIMHIPAIEYRPAADMVCEDVVSDGKVVERVVKGDYADTAFGSLKETICSPEGNNGFFAKCIELGSTKNMICGHDHVNDLSVDYEGIRLNYSLKCGPGCYWTPEKNGGSVLTIDSQGHGTFSHHYIALGE